MMYQEIVKTDAVWCRDCEYVEDPDFAPSETLGEQCMACGCPRSSHVEVHVVTVGEADRG